MKPRREMSLKTEPTGRELGKLDLTTRMWSTLGIWTGRKKMMRSYLKEGDEGVLDGELASLRLIAVVGRDVAADDDCQTDECGAGV